MLYFYRCECSKNPMKGRKCMHHNVLTKEKKGFILKVLFFISLLLLIGFIYLDSRLLKDAIYFVVVFILFIKFLFIKLYH